MTGIASFVNLKNLDCSGNILTNLEVHKNLKIQLLYCDNNELKSLDLSQNTNLRSLFLSKNELTELNLKNGNNRQINKLNFDATNNPNLSCIEVDDENYSIANWKLRDKKVTFSTACSSTKE